VDVEAEVDEHVLGTYQLHFSFTIPRALSK
jgi:hypothetical protein